jgi:hypothetical protein
MGVLEGTGFGGESRVPWGCGLYSTEVHPHARYILQPESPKAGFRKIKLDKKQIKVKILLALSTVCKSCFNRTGNNVSLVVSTLWSSVRVSWPSQILSDAVAAFLPTGGASCVALEFSPSTESDC